MQESADEYARALVVDDTAIFRRAISDALAGLPGVEVVGSAANGKLALDRIATLKPDVVTLDIEMPEMNGLDVLRSMRNSGNKTNVIILSTLTVRGGEMTIRALEAGAFDFVTKPEGRSPQESLANLRDSLRPILTALERRNQIRSLLNVKESLFSKPSVAPQPARTTVAAGPPFVVIGCSTGGPTALAEILSALSAKIGCPVFVVQHMPPHFTEALAQRLNGKCQIPVTEAREAEIAENNHVYIAPGGRHMKLTRGANGEIVIRITDDPPENQCRPAVDYLFRSAALNFPGRAVAAILTGMGSDGTEGMRMLKRGGSPTIAQDEASCVVYGMPREAFLAGVVDTVVPLSRIAESITRATARAQS